MKMGDSYTIRGLIVALAVLSGFLAGYLAFDHSSDVHHLNSLVARLQKEKAALIAAENIGKVASGPSETIGKAIKGGIMSTNRNDDDITDEEIAASRALDQRESKGEYILKFERPWDRRVMETGIKSLASKMTAEAAPEIRQIFSQAGIKPEMTGQLLNFQEKITLASLEFEQSQQQLLFARQEYDKRMRTLLDDESYAKYRELEGTRPVKQEYARVQEYASKHHLPLDPAMEPRIIDLIKTAQACTVPSWHNPYDGLPQTEVGEKAFNSALREIANIKQGGERIMSKAAETGLNEGYINLLNAYYREEAERRRFGLNIIADKMGYILPP